ncbi:MAG: efflux RND transporter periplasmic adaptor subunit [Gemmatimonadetes bacterium]|nr:efflux RND transporter periplasmic adaptor subunit [Gemmatimonadota bacterium]
MKRGTKVLVSTIVVAAIGGTAFMVSTAGGSEDGTSRSVVVERGEIVDKALAVGRIEPLVEVSVKSQLAGVVRRMYKEPGEYVQRGEPLLEVQPNPTPIELVEARRNVELREIELDQLERNRNRLEELRAQDYVSAEEFESVDRSYNEAKLQVQIAQERLALLSEGRVTIGEEQVETVITSPIAGFILEKMVEIGDPVVPLTTFQEGTVLMAMAEMEELLFRGTVDEIDVGRLSEGMPVEIKIGALPEADVGGRLSKISLKGRDEENATIFPVEIAVAPAQGTTLRAGYSANADVIIERRSDVLVIPERLVRFEDEAAFVTLWMGPEETEEREIETGLSDGINIEVTSGLAEGDRVMEPPQREIT